MPRARVCSNWPSMWGASSATNPAECVPCRVGSEKIVMLLEGILHGRGSAADLALIEELSETMALTSICGLGQAAPNPILSVIKYFKDDITRYIAR